MGTWCGGMFTYEMHVRLWLNEENTIYCHLPESKSHFLTANKLLVEREQQCLGRDYLSQFEVCGFYDSWASKKINKLLRVVLLFSSDSSCTVKDCVFQIYPNFVGVAGSYPVWISAVAVEYWSTLACNVGL